MPIFLKSDCFFVLLYVQPADELAMSLTQIITEISLERERKARLKSALAKEVEGGNVFDSSAIKYCVRQLTPHKNRSDFNHVCTKLIIYFCIHAYFLYPHFVYMYMYLTNTNWNHNFMNNILKAKRLKCKLKILHAVQP